MAKSTKSAKTDRQAVIDEIRKKQKGADKRRGYMIVGVCVVIALLIVGAAAFRPIKDWWDLRKFNDLDLASIGAPATVCQEVVKEPAGDESSHVPTDQEVTYEDSPPAFGSHWNEFGVAPDPIGRKFYGSDRPEVESLVHNLEHGYTILWYDETTADDAEMMLEVEAIASKFKGEENFRLKFKAVPWTAEDGEPFPDDQRIAFSHWTGGTDGGEQQGVWQYCSAPSGEAIEQFMIDYPYLDSPEPEAG